MKSATVWALDQKTIPAVPFRNGKLFATMQTRLDFLSLFRLLWKMCSRVTGIGKTLGGSEKLGAI